MQGREERNSSENENDHCQLRRSWSWIKDSEGKAKLRNWQSWEDWTNLLNFEKIKTALQR